MQRPAPIFDDEYTGKRWTYGIVLRPLTWSGVPQGYIINSAAEHDDFPFGTVDYPRELTRQEVDLYELVPLNPMAIDE